MKFAPGAFLDMITYLDVDETLADVQRYTDVIINGANNDIFQVRQVT